MPLPFSFFTNYYFRAGLEKECSFVLVIHHHALHKARPKVVIKLRPYRFILCFDQLLLLTAHINGNSLCHIILDVVVIQRVIVFVEALRSEEFSGGVLVVCGVRHDHATA